MHGMRLPTETCWTVLMLRRLRN